MLPWINLLIGIIVPACVVCSGLQCWKCIGKSCDQNPADNYRATQMTCQQGGSCMKVYYRMTENGSKILESTTRTCSAGRCVESNHQDFEKCLQTQRRYNVLGCSLRSCCHDKNLCNNAVKLRGSWILTVLWTGLYAVYAIRTNVIE